MGFTWVHQDTAEFFIWPLLLLVNGNPGDFFHLRWGGRVMKMRVLFSAIFADVFSFWSTFLQGGRGKKLAVMHSYGSLALQRARTEGQLSNHAFLPQSF